MSVATVDVFDTAVQKANRWLKEIMEELHWEDKHKAYLALRATLHTLRDRLTTEEAVHLGAQLPLVIRGLYFEGWKPGVKGEKKRDKEEFLSKIDESFSADPDIDPEEVARAIFRFLSRKISEGEVEDIKSILPDELRGLWP
ncbi:MAG: DUF2267 domain-containing protein [Alphaproteobacteria bacterium]|uniref:DUF2267 domain-containing protein n=1 Tax=Candidatus Nitrobium versatile TaxID=2884831 RepID=A0A953J6T3_9BACT|nr:DUF2267 domain-containing protein [Candidatus Nitrobium versatile]